MNENLCETVLREYKKAEGSNEELTESYDVAMRS